MSIQGISGSILSAKAKPELLGQKTKKSQQGTGNQVFDTVALRDKNFAYRVYSQSTLTRLAAIVNKAADELGVDLNTVDTSPEASSDRIAGFAISMFSLYKKQNPDMSEEEALVKYEKYIKRAIDKGYNEALKILAGLNINDPTTMSGIQKTYDLTMQKLDDFFHGQSEELPVETG